MSDRPTGRAPAVLKAVLGPTNTGKTHLAVERMLGHSSGMIGLPLRLLAREVYDRIVRARGGTIFSSPVIRATDLGPLALTTRS